ncbi:MAG: SDR family oxidoreductase [Nitrospirales bacterium]|nr:SDR family oxidoreductase [Nitrospirales bacterium]
MFNLAGKVAVITGGNGGIGLGMGCGLAEAGAKIVIAARNEKKMETAKAALEGKGTQVLTIPTDVGKKDSVDNMIAEAKAHFGRLDILINNAGINAGGPAEELCLEDWEYVLNTNLTSAFLCSHAIYPYMKQLGAGKIINIGSMMSIFGHRLAPAYAASKGGIVQFTRTLACSWAEDNIQANAILPGWIDTEMTQILRERLPEVHQSVIDRTPANRWGTIEDLSGIAVFLASSASDFITGAAIPVDGGYAIQG